MEHGVRAASVLLAAALRGVKVILVGSGTRDPEDAGITRNRSTASSTPT